jgi:hypothetical protein
MDFVCATEQNPPKEVSASIETYFSVWDSMFLDNIGIPLVISSIGRHMFDIKADFTGSICKRDNRTENNRIYPPTFVMVSNPSMMQVSTISKLKWMREDILVFPAKCFEKQNCTISVRQTKSVRMEKAESDRTDFARSHSL